MVWFIGDEIPLVLQFFIFLDSVFVEFLVVYVGFAPAELCHFVLVDFRGGKYGSSTLGMEDQKDASGAGQIAEPETGQFQNPALQFSILYNIQLNISIF